MEAEAKHDFLTKDPESELPFKKGDHLLLLNYGDPVEWYNAEKDGQTGLVPGNYVHIDTPSWYVGRMRRSTAEQMLQGSPRKGAFFVRLSESSPNDFSLSVKCENSVEHFRVLRNQEGKYKLWDESFDSLNKLVDYYRKHSVSTTDRTIVLLDEESMNNQIIVEALYDFTPEEGEAELEFKKGDLITVFNREDDLWWGGSLGGRQGYFPRAYVKEYDPSSKRH